MKKGTTWIVTLSVVSRNDNETAATVIEAIENALDDDAVLTECFDCTNVNAEAQG